MTKKELNRKIGRLEVNLSSLTTKINNEILPIRDELFEKDYFYGKCFYSKKEYVLKSESSSFKKADEYRDPFGNVMSSGVKTCYTTKKTYHVHYETIKEWEKRVKQLNK